MSPTAGDETSRGRNPENGRRRDLGRRRHRQSGFQYTDRPRPSSPELLNEMYVFVSGVRLKCFSLCKREARCFSSVDVINISACGGKDIVSTNEVCEVWYLVLKAELSILKRVRQRDGDVGEELLPEINKDLVVSEFWPSARVKPGTWVHVHRNNETKSISTTIMRINTDPPRLSNWGPQINRRNTDNIVSRNRSQYLND